MKLIYKIEISNLTQNITIANYALKHYQYVLAFYLLQLNVGLQLNPLLPYQAQNHFVDLQMALFDKSTSHGSICLSAP